MHLRQYAPRSTPGLLPDATGSKFVLRIEDTDVERSSQAAVDVIHEGMKWLGLDLMRSPYYQMQRMDRYKEVLSEMVAAGHVYPCYT
ncbi:MAG: glutamate--tRNA ligase family protein [Burkholderiaceae bacterium]